MSKISNQRFTFAATAISAVLLASLTACSPAGDAAATESSTVAEPTTIENCGYTLTTDPAPERVVTVKSTPLELMLALGLEERVVGSAFLDGPVPDAFAPDGWEPNVISDELPSKELLIAAKPDLVFAGWESNLSTDGIGTREDLEQLGMRSYVSPPACSFGISDTEPLTFDGVFEMYSEVGALFGIEDRAERLISEQQEQLAAIAPLESPTTALWYSSGGDAPFVGGSTGAPNMIMEAAGLTNVVADEPQSWFSMPWEAFVASDPDVIVLVDAPWNSADEKRARLEAHPATRTMRAVQQRSYIVVDFATTEAGVRNIEAVESISHDARTVAG